MSSGFITEKEATELTKRRQEEWERVRKADDPLERPEEPYDCRSLFERLQEQKQKRDLEYEEAHKLKNMIKGLDDDEIEFLDLVDRTKLEADRKKEIEEELELKDYRNRVAILQEKIAEDRLQTEVVVNKPKIQINNKSSQQKLLKGIVVKKGPECRKRKKEQNSDDENGSKAGDNTDDVDNMGDNLTTSSKYKSAVPKAGLECIGILPGLGCYADSSSDECSSDSELETKKFRTDLLGRKILKQEGNKS